MQNMSHSLRLQPLRSSARAFLSSTGTARYQIICTSRIALCARYQSTTAAASATSRKPAANGISAPPILSSYLVSPQALSNALRQNANTKISTAPRVMPLCAAWFMPNDPEKRTGRGAYLAGHVPGARFFDIDAVCDKKSPYPHMLPSPEDFARAMSQLGIRKDDTVVLYDSAELGIFSAPRAAWTFKAFGHGAVHVLNNFKIWVDQGFPVEKGEPEQSIEQTNYPTPQLDSTLLISYEDLKERINEQGKEGAEKLTILDARSAGRFDGSAPEPRPGLSSGHMPQAINIPFGDVLSARTKAFLTPDELKVYFDCRNVDPDAPIVSSCGTGVTACILDTALTEAGYSRAGRRVYDGSWTEWASLVDEKEGLIVKDKE